MVEKAIVIPGIPIGLMDKPEIALVIEYVAWEGRKDEGITVHRMRWVEEKPGGTIDIASGMRVRKMSFNRNCALGESQREPILTMAEAAQRGYELFIQMARSLGELQPVVVYRRRQY